MGKKMNDHIPRAILLKKMRDMHDSGMSYAEISEELGLSIIYVSQQVQAIKRGDMTWLDEPEELEGLQVRTSNCLKSKGIRTRVDLLAAIERGDIHAKNKWPNFGQKCVEDIQKFAKEHFGDDVAGMLDVSKKITPAVAAEMMRELSESGDSEGHHESADILLCQILRENGFGEAADIFERMDKWYD